MPVALSITLVAVLAGLTLSEPGISAAGTTPPSSTPQQRAEAVVDPSLVLIQVNATGEVNVPFADETTRHYQEKSVGLCSGAAIDTGDILTAGHCADTGHFTTDLIDSAYASLKQQGLTDTVTQQQAESGWTVSGTKLGFTIYQTPPAQPALTSGYPASPLFDEGVSNGDVAVLGTKEHPLPSLQVANGNPADGADIVSFGYPGSVTSESNVDLSTLQPTEEPGQTTGIQMFNGKDFISISAAMSPGVSGGPTTDLTGKVYGTNSFAPASDAGQSPNFITSTAEVDRVLRANHLSFTLSPADQAWRTSLNDYFAGEYHQAVPGFNQVLRAFPNDLLAKQYRAKAIADYPLQTSNPSFPYATIALVVLAVVVVAIGWTLVLRRRRRSRGTGTAPGGAGDPGLPR
jgi:serine protease Do